MESFVDSDDDDDEDDYDDEEDDDDDEDFMEGDSEEEEGPGRRRCRGDFDDYRSDYTSTTEGTSVSRQYLRKTGRSGNSRRRRDHHHGHKSHHHYRNRNNMSRVSCSFLSLFFSVNVFLFFPFAYSSQLTQLSKTYFSDILCKLLLRNVLRRNSRNPKP